LPNSTPTPYSNGRWLALTLALGAALYLCWTMVQPFLSVILWAAVLAVVFSPVHRRLLARFGRPSMTAALSTVLVVVTILVPITAITVAVLGEFGSMVDSVRAGNLQQSIEQTINQSPLFHRLVEWVSPYLAVHEFSAADVTARLQGFAGAIANSTIGIVGGVVATVAQMLLVIFTLFYLFRDGDAIVRTAYDVLPLERRQTHDVIDRTTEVIAATVYGVMVIAAIQGMLGGFIFWALGLPSPLLWAVVMFFLSMIPMAGAFLVWAPAAVFLAISGQWQKALFLTAWGVLVVGSIDNFLSPRLVGKRTRLHELLVFFSVLGGIQVFGVLGIVLGPVVVALTLALLDVVRQVNRPPSETTAEESVVERQAP
jgi:predicted PurR-regulated permease PerM